MTQDAGTGSTRLAPRSDDTGNRRNAAVDQLFPLVYDELHRLAHRLLDRARPGDTLVTTALVHEAYLKLADPAGDRVWNDRAHFFAVAARAMRQILVDYARNHRAQKRGAGRRRVSLDDSALSVDDQAEALLALDEALDQLGQIDDRLARVVELRFFAGLSEEQAAQSLGVTTRTLRRDWVKAKALLYEEMGA